MTTLAALFGLDDDGLDWRADAACASTDPEIFYPEKGGSTGEAKAVCGGCIARADCLAWALTHEERFGVWGALSERERRRLSRRPSAA